MTDKKLKSWRFYLFVGCVGSAHVLVLFNAGAYIAMLPRVAGGLWIPPSVATWTQTDYMICLALGFPVGNWLSRRVGEYRPFVYALLTFAAASAVCAYCQALYGYLLARVVLGFAGGVTLPIGQSLAIKEFPERRKIIGTGIWSFFTLIPFTFGPVYGGWLADNLGWRWLFKFNVPVALVISGLTLSLLHGRVSQKVRRHFDVVGFLLMTVSLLGLQTLLNQGNDWDWVNSPYLMGLLGLTGAGFVHLAVWELSLKQPFLDLRLFKQRNFTIGAIIMFIGFLFFQGLLSLLIIQLQLSLGYSSFLAGVVFLPMAIFAKPVGSFFHVINKYFDARLLASLNLLGFSFVYFWLSHFDQSADYAQLFWPKVLEGVCLGSFFLPLTVLLLHGLPVERQWRAIELAGMMRIAAGAIGITFQGIVFYRRLPFHFSRAMERPSAFDPGWNNGMEQLISMGVSEPAAQARLLQLAKQQARLWAINEAFWFAGWVFVALAVIVWLAHPVRPAAKSSSRQAIRRESLLLLVKEE